MNEKELLKILNKEKCYTEEDLLVLNIQRELIKNEIKQNNLMVESVKEQKYNKLLRENQQLKDRIELAIEYIRDCCNMDSKWTNLHFDYAQNEMLSDQVDELLDLLKGDKE